MYINTPPIAVAGENQFQEKDISVTLNGSGSSDPDGDLLIYYWTLESIPEGSVATLSNDTSESPSFFADKVGKYVASLVVYDGESYSPASLTTVIVDTIVIYKNDFSDGYYDEFVVGEYGSAQVMLEGGQLAILPGGGYLNRGFVALNLASISSDYNSMLSDNVDRIIWGFNVSNVDGDVCGACNNTFFFNLHSDQDPSIATGFGYALTGGGFVGSSVMFTETAAASSIYGSINNTIIDLSNGPEPLPTIGAFRLEYYPALTRWELFYEESTIPLDPMKIESRAGYGINSGISLEDLPYLILSSYNTKKAVFDNLSVVLKFNP